MDNKYLDRLARQLKVGKSPACCRAINPNCRRDEETLRSMWLLRPNRSGNHSSEIRSRWSGLPEVCIDESRYRGTIKPVRDSSVSLVGKATSAIWGRIWGPSGNKHSWYHNADTSIQSWSWIIRTHFL